jgi:predicted heme/steroid binding protein
MLWSGDKAWRQSGERRILCGLQLAGPDGQQLAFKGKVADVDQSKVWPAGTCVGIDPTSNQPTDTPVDCAAPHAMEITGAVNLAEKFPGGLPAEPDQDAFIKDTCTKMTDAYLAPIQLRATTLTLTYNTISLPSWAAGSHQVACSIGATLGNGGWATLLNSAKGPVLINGQPPIAPPDIPEERLNMPPIPLPDPSAAQSPSYDSTYDSGSGSSSSSSGSSSTSQTDSNQHLPGQPATSASSTPSPTASVPPTQGNTFNPLPPGAPPAPVDPSAPLPPADAPPPVDALPPADAPPMEAPAPGPPPGPAPVILPPPA